MMSRSQSAAHVLDVRFVVCGVCMQGCVSQVWVVPSMQDGKIFWKADSDAQLTKGLAALLVNGLSGCEPDKVAGIEADFIEMLGLKQSLTPSRNNGFLNMFRLMQVQWPHCSSALRTGETHSTGL